nr:hypothetical protein [Neobacillus sp. Marseille-Q6967]
MPRGKELEQLPMANILPGAGKDTGKYDRTVLEGSPQQIQPEPSDINKDNEDMV